MKSKNLKTVFIVEDSEMERTMLQDHLESYPDLKVTTYSSGNACVKELILGNVKGPDLILMDYFMDTSFGASNDGLDTLVKIKEICPETDIIMFTSVDNEKIMELARKKGALDYVMKGISGFDQIDAALEKHYALKKQV